MRVVPTTEHFAEIQGVEVFRPGTHHGRTYSNADMIRMAANSNRMLPHLRGKLKIGEPYAGEPIIKIGHDPASDFFKQAAMGVSARYYTRKISISGGEEEDRVFADFTNVPDVVAKAIPGHFPERSVEKYRVLPDPFTQEPVEDVIASVAFLGTIPPEVKALSAEYAVLFEEYSGSATSEREAFSFMTGGQTLDGQDETERERHSLSDLEDMLKRMVADAVNTALHGVRDMNKKDQVKARWMAGASDEELMKEFEGLLPDELQAWKAEWDKEKSEKTPAEKPAEKSEKTPAEKPAEKSEKTPDGFSEASAPAYVTAQTFSDDQIQRIVGAAVTAQVEKFSAKISVLEERLAASQAKTKRAEHEALETWYHGLKSSGLPASLDALAPVAFMERLNSDTLETFGEGQPQVSMQDQFKAMLQAFADVAKITATPMVPDTMKQGTGKDTGYQATLERFQSAHPEMTKQQVLFLMAKDAPEAFSEV